MANTIIGRKFIVDLGVFAAELHFESDNRLTFIVRDGGGLTEPGYTETVDITMVEVRPGVYFTSWREHSGTTISHLDDFVSGTVYSNATLPDGSFYRMQGTLTASV